MALSARSRAALLEGLTPLATPEAIEEMLAYFPARDADEPVTRDHLDARLADLRGELHTGLADLRTEMADLRGELHTGLADLRGDMQRLANRSLVAVMGTMLTGMGLAAAIS